MLIAQMISRAKNDWLDAFETYFDCKRFILVLTPTSTLEFSFNIAPLAIIFYFSQRFLKYR